jgi:tellurite resistance protein TerC
MGQWWLGFIVLVVALLWLDLGVLNRHNRVMGTREALRWTALWVSVSLAFNVFVYFLYERRLGGFQSTLGGWDAAKVFFAGYLLEYSLSLDNVFVIALIFQYFAVPPASQHRALFWGILGALIFRGVMIVAGAALLGRFEWMMYVFGAILLLTAIRMLRSDNEQVEPEHNPLVRFARRVYPVSSAYDGARMFTRLPDGRWAMTPLFLVLLVIESTDVIFAVDSIPAVFGVTREPFIVFTSNIFAILGLRSLYFVLAGMMRRFHHVKTSLIFVLAFIAVKMLLAEHVHISIDASLAVLATAIGLGVVASLLSAPPRTPEEEELADESRLPLDGEG